MADFCLSCSIEYLEEAGETVDRSKVKWYLSDQYESGEIYSFLCEGCDTGKYVTHIDSNGNCVAKHCKKHYKELTMSFPDKED